jgi:tRNA-splicing ligase RtcB
MVKKIDKYRFLVEKSFVSGMNVEGLIFADEELMKAISADQTLKQVANVATLPGIIGKSLAMPDAHQGYGFPIGGVAAMDIEKGVVSAGGVGFDINCGVRLLASNIQKEELLSKLDTLLDRLFRTIPCGAGRRGPLNLSPAQLDEVLIKGARWAVEKGYGTKEDIGRIEEGGEISGASPREVSRKAKERGHEQLGTLGSGNHFVEVQYVADIFDDEAAKAFGLIQNAIVVTVHSGSRGLGHQVCTDYLEDMLAVARKENIPLVDRQLACAPINSIVGQNYIKAMSAAANFAFANRQMITHWVREAFKNIIGEYDLHLVYDIAHNIAKREQHIINGNKRTVLVHRKGATRAFPKHDSVLPKEYFEIGQPVLIPGSMGTSTYVMVGTELGMEETFGSCCHGAGRAKSRTSATKDITAEKLVHQLNEKGIKVRGASKSGLTEEHPGAYKDVSHVVEIVHNAGIAKKVACLIPIGVIKG